MSESYGHSTFERTSPVIEPCGHFGAETTLVDYVNESSSEDSSHVDEDFVRVAPGKLRMRVRDLRAEFPTDGGGNDPDILAPDDGGYRVLLKYTEYNVSRVVLSRCVRLPADSEMALMSNLLGRFPGPAYTQVVHLDKHLCQALLSARVVVPVPAEVHFWDIVESPTSVTSKACLVPTGAGEVRRMAVGKFRLPFVAHGSRALVCVPVLSQADEYIEVALGGLTVAPPADSKFSHFGLSVPVEFLGEVTFMVRAVSNPFFYLKVGECGARSLQGHGIMGAVLSGLDTVSQPFDLLSGMPTYAIYPVKSGGMVVRFREISSFVIGCVSVVFPEPCNMRFEVPHMHARIALYVRAVFAGDGGVPMYAVTKQQKKMCAHAVHDESKVEFATFLGLHATTDLGRVGIACPRGCTHVASKPVAALRHLMDGCDARS